MPEPFTLRQKSCTRVREATDFSCGVFTPIAARAARRASVVFLSCVALTACGSQPPPGPRTNDAPPSADRVLAQIDAARAERGLPPANVVPDSGPLAAATSEILSGATPDRAIRTALQRVVESETSEASGWCLPTDDVLRLDLPSVVLEQREVYLSVVAIRKPRAAGAPPFVVCLLVFEDGPEIPSTDG
jgi:hypothetical protein